MLEPTFIEVRENEHYRISDIREFYLNSNYKLTIVFESFRRNWSVTIDDTNRSKNIYSFLRRYSLDPVKKDLTNA